jgi:hypothetical protein
MVAVDNGGVVGLLPIVEPLTTWCGEHPERKPVGSPVFQTSPLR